MAQETTVDVTRPAPIVQASDVSSKRHCYVVTSSCSASCCCRPQCAYRTRYERVAAVVAENASFPEPSRTSSSGQTLIAIAHADPQPRATAMR